MAAEIAVVHPTQTVTLIHSRAKLLSAEPLPDDFKDQTVTLLEDSGVKVILGQRVISNEPAEIAEDGSPSYTLTLSNGTTMKAGHVIFAISHQTPITSYFPKEVLDEEGYVHVSPSYVPSNSHISHVCQTNRCQLKTGTFPSNSKPQIPLRSR